LKKFKKTEYIFVIFLIIILFASLIYLNFKTPDYEYQDEAFKAAQHMYSITKVANYYSEATYLDNARLVVTQNFPVLRMETTGQVF
jgi:hypothetical protein